MAALSAVKNKKAAKMREGGNTDIEVSKKDMKLIDEQLGGTTPLDIIIQFKDEPNDDFSFEDSDTLKVWFFF